LGTKLARNVKKGKEEKRDGERGKGMTKYLQRSSRSSWDGSVDLPGPPPPFPPLFNPAIAPLALPAFQDSDLQTPSLAKTLKMSRERKKTKKRRRASLCSYSNHGEVVTSSSSVLVVHNTQQKSQPHATTTTTTTLTQQGKKKIWKILRIHTLSSSLSSSSSSLSPLEISIQRPPH
jgi:hypothetical protein